MADDDDTAGIDESAYELDSVRSRRAEETITMPMPAKAQNQPRAGKTVMEPIRKATASVAEVMRMETPPWRKCSSMLAAIWISKMETAAPHCTLPWCAETAGKRMGSPKCCSQLELRQTLATLTSARITPCLRGLLPAEA